MENFNINFNCDEDVSCQFDSEPEEITEANESIRMLDDQQFIQNYINNNFELKHG